MKIVLLMLIIIFENNVFKLKKMLTKTVHGYQEDSCGSSEKTSFCKGSRKFEKRREIFEVKMKILKQLKGISYRTVK